MPTGSLIVQTRAARNAMPVAGASVIVFVPDAAGDMQPMETVFTNLSGQTEKIMIAAPQTDEFSQEAPPYTAVRVEIAHPNYRPVTVLQVAVFRDITTTLPVTMIPPRSIEELNARIVIDSAETGPSGSGADSAEILS